MCTIYRKFLTGFLLLLIFIFLSCGDDDNPVIPGAGGIAYPLKIGNTWNYDRMLILEDSQGNNIDTLRSDISIEISGTHTLSSSIGTYVFYEKVFEEGNGTPIESWTYYNHESDGFYIYGYNDTGNAIPKTGCRALYTFMGKSFTSIREIFDILSKHAQLKKGSFNDIRLEVPPKKVLHYPLQLGLQWDYRDPGDPWEYDKKVISEETVNVPAGSFDCFKIQWLIDMDGDSIWDTDIEFYDYICSRGMIKRTIVLRGVTVTDNDGNYIGSEDSTDEYLLTALVIK